MLIKIKNDLFNISSRIKEIDDGYEIFFNTKLSRFEVHNKYQKNGSLASVLPFDRLDCRTIKYLCETHVRNAKKIFDTIDKNNANLECEVKNERENCLFYKLNEIYNYSNRSTKSLNVDFSNFWA